MAPEPAFQRRRRPHLLALTLVAGLVFAGCGKGDKAANEEVDLAALRARRDSIVKARAVADSIARVKYQTCADSVTALLQKTAAGRRQLRARKDSLGTIPEMAAACGQAPAAAVAAADTGRKADSAKAPMAAAPDTAGKKPVAAAPAQPPAKQPAAAQGPTPQQLQVMRADSIRKAQAQARADSVQRAQAQARADSTARMRADSVRADSVMRAKELEITRETYAYGGATRDPFSSLINVKSTGPEFVNLQLVAIYQDLRYAGNSIAVVRDKAANKRYSVRAGDRIGNIRVAQIRQRDVVFTIEDLGFERQETLSLRKREEQTP